MKRIELDQRLSLVAAMVRPCEAAVDVGADHGKLLVRLVQDGTVRRGLATDLREMPLERARREIARWGLERQIGCLCADGLTGLEPGVANCVVIAGMGGELIARILADCPWREKAGVQWLLQPMSRPEAVRRYLLQNGFAIDRERCCAAAGKRYLVMEARFTGERRAGCDADYYIGEIEGRPGSEERAYLLEQYKHTGLILERLAAAKQPDREAGELWQRRRERALALLNRYSGEEEPT